MSSQVICHTSACRKNTSLAPATASDTVLCDVLELYCRGKKIRQSSWNIDAC